MYRRAILNQYAVRFPDSSYIPVEEDQVFNMKAYSVSRKISILADKDYYYWNQREDFDNLGKSSSYTIMNLGNTSTSYRRYSILLRRLLIAGLRKIINERMDSQSISEVRQASRWMVLGIKYGMNDEELSNLETELFSDEKSLVQNIQSVNGVTVKKLSINGRTCAIPVCFLKNETSLGTK